MNKRTSFYGLTFDPFDKEQLKVSDCFHSADFDEALSRLNYIKDARGIGVLTAGSGMGKSYTIRCFIDSLNANLYDFRYICMSTVSVMDFYHQLCDTLGMEASGRKSAMFKMIQTQITSMRNSGRTLILFIDEAQFLKQSILDDIRLLMNFEIDSRNCFTLILSGEKSLNMRLNTPVNEALRQRILTHYVFNGLTEEESAKYVLYKLQRAGGSKELINDAALSAVSAKALGCPRLIDQLMTVAMMIGSQNNKVVIDAETIEAAVDLCSF